MSKMKNRYLVSPSQTESKELITVEELIGLAMGPPDRNMVNFKMVQAILYILAQQMRILEQHVDLRITDESIPTQSSQTEIKKSSSKIHKKPTISEFEEKLNMTQPKKHHENVNLQKIIEEDIDQIENNYTDKSIEIPKPRASYEKLSTNSQDKDKIEVEENIGRYEDKTELSKSTVSGKLKAKSGKFINVIYTIIDNNNKNEKLIKQQTGKSKFENNTEVKEISEGESKKATVQIIDKTNEEKGSRIMPENQENANMIISTATDKEGKIDTKERQKSLKEKTSKHKTVDEDNVGEKEENKDKKIEKTLLKISKMIIGDGDLSVGAEKSEKRKRHKPPSKYETKIKQTMELKELEEAKSKDKISSISVDLKHESKEKVTKESSGISVKGSRTVFRPGSIEVVTLPKFRRLEELVQELMEKATPLPTPVMPDDQQLKEALAHGRASLSDTMNAMQVSARLQAAEAAIVRLGGVLTQLAASGALPRDVLAKVREATAHIPQLTQDSSKSSSRSADVSATFKLHDTPSAALAHNAPPHLQQKNVSHNEMQKALRAQKQEILRSVNTPYLKATRAVAAASVATAKLAEHTDLVTTQVERIDYLDGLINDYALQMAGHDAAVNELLGQYNEQIADLRRDIRNCLIMIDIAKNYNSSNALSELKQRHENVMGDLDSVLMTLKQMFDYQKQLSMELQLNRANLEYLAEQKADHEEIQDGLKDKADISRLSHLVTYAKFNELMTMLDEKLKAGVGKFKNQEEVWLRALRELHEFKNEKADLYELEEMKHDLQIALNKMRLGMRKLALKLGEPKAAVLSRAISQDGRCCACMIPAIQESVDPYYGKPRLFPSRHSGGGDCEPVQQLPQLAERRHMCNRWVGGSHTVMSPRVQRQQAPPAPTGPPSRKYTGTGRDNRSYYMEEPLEPCACNLEPGTGGSGNEDSDAKRTNLGLIQV